MPKIRIHEDDECPVYLWDRGEAVDLRDKGPLVIVLPTEIHICPEGDIYDNPSLFLVMKDTDHGDFQLVTQISLAKLWPAVEAALKVKGTDA